MPETMIASCGCTLICARPCLTAFRMPKSPQPGHQVGFSPPLKSLTSSIDLDLRAGLAPHGRHNLVGEDGAAVVLQYPLVHRLAGVGAQQLAELAGEVLFDQHELLSRVQDRKSVVSGKSV